MTNAQEFQAGTDSNNPASAPSITALTPNGSDILITFASVAGKRYDAWRTEDLAGGMWTSFTNVIAGGSSTQVTDPGGAIQPLRFYRVQVLP